MKILVAIDSSIHSSDVLAAVNKCRWDDHTSIRLVTAVTPAASWEETEQFVHQCSVILTDRVQKLKSALPQCVVQGEVLEGPPGKMILETATNWGANLIVIGSHGDTGPRPTKAGSVASEVVNFAPCSVHIVKVGSAKSQDKFATASQAKKSR